MRGRKDKSNGLQGAEGGINEQGQRAGQRETEKGNGSHARHGGEGGIQNQGQGARQTDTEKEISKAPGSRLQREELKNRGRVPEQRDGEKK